MKIIYNFLKCTKKAAYAKNFVVNNFLGGCKVYGGIATFSIFSLNTGLNWIYPIKTNISWQSILL